MKVFFAAMLVGFACVGAYVCGEQATPLVQDAAVRSYRTVTQQDEIDQLKAEVEAWKREAIQSNLETAELHLQVRELEKRPETKVIEKPVYVTDSFADTSR